MRCRVRKRTLTFTSEYIEYMCLSSILAASAGDRLWYRSEMFP